MSGRASRSKGKRGELAFRRVLEGRDWRVHDLTDGEAVADFIAIDPSGRAWCVECKNCAAILPAHMAQARRQAQAARMPWLLAHHIAGTQSWLIQRKGERPAVWHGAADA